jgi:hypothetical protein
VVWRNLSRCSSVDHYGSPLSRNVGIEVGSSPPGCRTPLHTQPRAGSSHRRRIRPARVGFSACCSEHACALRQPSLRSRQCAPGARLYTGCSRRFIACAVQQLRRLRGIPQHGFGCQADLTVATKSVVTAWGGPQLGQVVRGVHRFWAQLAVSLHSGTAAPSMSCVDATSAGGPRSHRDHRSCRVAGAEWSYAFRSSVRMAIVQALLLGWLL